MNSVRVSLFAFTSLLCACSQSVQVTQPPAKPTSHIVTDTLDFGTDPLWREADTTVWIALASHNAISSITISDSNFTLLDTSRINDSLRISLRFQPQSLANHSGLCLLLSKQDTLATLMLLGLASPFKRRVGDSYVYMCQNDTGSFQDTITLISINGSTSLFVPTGSGLIDRYLYHEYIVGSEQLFLNFNPIISCLINVSSRASWDTSASGSNGSSSTWWTSTKTIAGADTTYSYRDLNIKAIKFSVFNLGASWRGPRLGYTTQDNDTLTVNYCSDIGFISEISLQGGTHEYYGIDYNTRDRISDSYYTENYHLLRFHLRR